MSKMPSSNHRKATISTDISYVHLGLLLLLGIISYANSFTVPILFDDTSIVNSSNTRMDLFSIKAFISKARWFTDVTFELNRRLHGEQVFGFHLFNLIIHLSGALVSYLLVCLSITALKQTFQISADDSDNVFVCRFIPFATAALFVCHPVQTQAVTYIAQRYTSLTTLLYLSSLASYLLTRVSNINKLSSRLWGASCVLLALLAMKSKEIAFTLPLMIAAFEVILFRGKQLKSPLFLALGAGLLLIIPLQLIYTLSAGSSAGLLHQVRAAATETQTISRIDYLLTQVPVVATYLRLLILPINQNLDYDYPVYHSLLNRHTLAALLLHVMLAITAAFLSIRSGRYLASDKPWTGLFMRLAGLGTFWFYLALSVESSLVPIKDVIFEHRIYLPSLGYFMAASAGLAGIVSYRPKYRTAVWSALALLCLVFTTSTIARNRIWSDEMTLWQDVLKKSPNKARARYNIGLFYSRKFMFEQALPHLVKALEIDPNLQEFWLALNAAMPLLRKYEGRCSAGYEYQTNFVTVDPQQGTPWMANSYNNLGLAYEHGDDLFRARECFLKATTINPSLDRAWYNLALIAIRQNDTATVDTARKWLRTLNPQFEQDVAHIIQGRVR